MQTPSVGVGRARRGNGNARWAARSQICNSNERQAAKGTNLPPLLRACPFRSLRVIYRHPSFEKYHSRLQSISLALQKLLSFLIPIPAVQLASLNVHRAFPLRQLTNKHTTTLTHLRYITSGRLLNKRLFS